MQRSQPQSAPCFNEHTQTHAACNLHTTIRIHSPYMPTISEVVCVGLLASKCCVPITFVRHRFRHCASLQLCDLQRQCFLRSLALQAPLLLRPLLLGPAASLVAFSCDGLLDRSTGSACSSSCAWWLRSPHCMSTYDYKTLFPRDSQPRKLHGVEKC